MMPSAYNTSVTGAVEKKASEEGVLLSDVDVSVTEAVEKNTSKGVLSDADISASGAVEKKASEEGVLSDADLSATGAVEKNGSEEENVFVDCVCVRARVLFGLYEDVSN